MRLFEVFIVVSSFLTFGAICVQAYIYNSQLKAMERSTKAATDAAEAAKDSVELARRTSRRDQRAWVTVTRADLVHPLEADARPIIKLRVRNSGKTPAIRVRITGEAYISAAPKAQVADTTSQDETVIGPDCAWYPEIEMNAPISEFEISGILVNMNPIHVSGAISYWDVFEKSHSTQFCFFLKGHNLSEGVFSACLAGNAMDKDEKA